MHPALNVRASGANGARSPAETLHPVLPNATENPAVLREFLKRGVVGDHFHQICMDGRPDRMEKKISVFEQKRIRVDGALGFVHTNPDTFETAYSFDINDRPSVHTKPVNSVTETVLF